MEGLATTSGVLSWITNSIIEVSKVKGIFNDIKMILSSNFSIVSCAFLSVSILCEPKEHGHETVLINLSHLLISPHPSLAPSLG